MFKDGFNHAAVMHALTQPQSLININTRPHITSLRIKGTYRYDHEDEDLNVDEDNSFLRSRSERLRARYGAQKIDDSCSNPPIYSQTDNDHFSPMAISTSNAKEVDKNLVEFLKNKEQDNSKTVMYESIMSFILDKLQSNSEKDCGYKYTFLCGCEYLGQVINDTHLTSLSFKNTDMTNDWLYNFAKHLPTSHIASLVLPRIIDDLQTIDEKYKKEDISSDTDSSHEDVKCRTKKPKITEDDTSCNEKIVNNGLEYLASILKDTEIRCLDFGGNHVNLKMLSCSLVGSKLTSLSLRSCKIQNDGLSFLARILKDTLINSIDLSENELDCQHLKIFVPGLEGTNITSLNLSFNKIGVDGMDCLASVLKTTEVAVLDISDNNLTCKSIEVFLNHLVDSKITSLSLKNNYIGTDGLSCLGRVLKNTQITSLDVSGIEFNSEIMEMFASSLTDTKITFLGLERNYIDIDELCMLLDVMGNTRITSINLHNNDWDLDDKNPDGINRLERLLTNPQITSINIGNGDRFNLFASSLIGSNITYLGLKEQSLSINELELLGDVLKNSKISSIDLSDNELDEESFKVLVPLLVDSKITSLNLSGNSPYYDGINCLGSALKNTKIISLSLSNCSMSCNTVRHFVMYLPDSKIKSLDLSGNVLCCNSFYLAFILKHTQITTLDISSQQFKEYNVDPICLLQLFKSIDTSLHLIDRNLCTTNWYFLALNLSNTGINSLKVTDGGTDSEELKYLCQGLLNSQVVDLDLTRNNIDCSKVYYLAKVLKHTRISSLNLAKNEIEDEGIKYLTKELVGSKLKSLDLYQNFISDAGIQGLAESLVGTHLLELNLRDNRISSDSAYNLSESVEKSNLKSMHIQIDFRVKKVYVDLNVFKYENCLIDIVESFSSEGIDDFVKKVYQKAGITQLILEGEEFPHLAGAFDNMNIDEVVIAKLFEDEESEVISCLENSNIGELKIEWCDLSPNYFEKMKVIALQIQNDHNAAPDDETLQLSLMKSNIVYLDLSGIEIDEIEFPTLVDALPGSKIISLNLSGNEIGRSGIKSLAKVLPATNITYINLDDNFIGLRGFKYLMNVAKNTKLCWLSLKNNGIEKDFGGVIQLSPFIVPRIDNPIEFQIRYLFKELVTLNPSTEQFEFILPRDDSHTTIIHYPRLVKLLLDKSIYKMHIYDYFYMQSEKHSLHLLNSINAFVEQIKPNFISFFESNIMQLDEMFGYDSFVSLVVEFNRSNLNEFVEFLLLHRVLYYVDDEKNFLHPLVYKMLLEHNMPIFIEEIEPNKKQQIITYFEKHTELEGAQEIIDLLK